MLLEPNAQQPLQQGDILNDVPFVVLAKVFNVKANNVQGQSRLSCEDLATFDAVKQFSQGNVLTAASLPLVLQPGMVITQGCDIDHRDFITLARVFPLTMLVEQAKQALDYEEPLVLHEVIRRLTEGHDYPHLVYLGALDGQTRYVADLLRVQSFPKEWKSCFRQRRWKTLTSDGLMYVQARLSFLAGRYATQHGFWHTLPDDKNGADALTQNPGALDEAKSRLGQKMAHKERK